MNRMVITLARWIAGRKPKIGSEATWVYYAEHKNELLEHPGLRNGDE